MIVFPVDTATGARLGASPPRRLATMPCIAASTARAGAPLMTAARGLWSDAAAQPSFLAAAVGFLGSTAVMTMLLVALSQI